MPKYKVLVLGIQGLNKKVFKAGAVVTDEQFPEGVAAILAKKGYLELKGEDKAKAAKALKDAKEEVETTSDEYRAAQVAVKELEGELPKASEGKKEEIEKAIEKAKTTLKEAEVKLNGAKAKLKKLQ